ncbi:hypothetical protein RB196_09250 [Streptomyces sp. PmtA]|uniref:hypothetical protein n=1 Tax=Streptomyces sp. PmtA TaxID=3074275 RepID=UPI003014E55E
MNARSIPELLHRQIGERARRPEGSTLVVLHPECPCGVFAADTDDNAAGNVLPDQVAGLAHETIRNFLVDEAFKDQLVMHGAGLGIDLESVERNPQETLEP